LLVAHNLGTKQCQRSIFILILLVFLSNQEPMTKQYVFFKIYIIRKGGIILDFFSMEFILFLFLPKTILLLYN